ncbi:hypothetical protein MSAN_00464800 [Mycena sanguinolenta]|uniref:F-box domain-containing protein n=1 Tax=Mycena sanguinolenta TaxID=230812 RepID=A0A8H6ZDM6_9AGAR|nr:hypothetical protein MSAN_00464800 [Mycena sanguinolenta]
MDEPVDYLRLLPPEVWIACWVFCTSRQLRRISVVCRLFRSLCLPFVFQHQSLNLAALETGLVRDNWVDRFHHVHRIAVRLDRLAASPFPALVRSRRVTFGRAPRMERSDIKHIELFLAMRDRVLATFYATLGLYYNLSSLHIEASKIDRASWETLMSLPRLKKINLHVQNIDMGERNIGGRHSEEALRTASPSKLHSLHLVYALHLLNGFATSELSSLVHLSIRSVRKVEPFLRFIQQCPCLESIAIESFRRQATLASIHVNPHSLPRLRALVGPSCLLRSLVPNRPISSVRFMDRKPELDELLSACSDISRSSVHVHSLTLPRTFPGPTFEFLHNIISMFPNMKELSIELCNAVFICRGSWGLPDSVYPIDKRLPVFTDADTLDSLPAEELSDDEMEDAPIDVNVISEGFDGRAGGLFTSHIEIILKWISDGSLALPSEIESFRLEASEKLALMKQHQALVSFSGRYPRLRELRFGSTGTWRRSGELWKSEDKAWVRVTGRTSEVFA